MQLQAVLHEEAVQAAQNAATAEINTAPKQFDVLLQDVSHGEAVQAAQNAATAEFFTASEKFNVQLQALSLVDEEAKATLFRLVIQHHQICDKQDEYRGGQQTVPKNVKRAARRIVQEMQQLAPNCTLAQIIEPFGRWSPKNGFVDLFDCT